MRIRRTLIALAGLALAAPLALAPAPASLAGEVPRPTGSSVQAGGLLGPLSLDVTSTGTAWFSQNFAGRLMRKRPGVPAKSVWRHPRGAEVGAVTAEGPGVAFAITNKARTALMVLDRGKGVRTLARLSRVEANRNPDAGNTYGIRDLGDCEVEPFLQPSPGIVESHPYATTYRGGRWYVADAAANAIFSVNGNGRVRTLAVLPPQPAIITEGAAAANGLPECTIGKTFDFEAVPTDVERGPDGMLYVTTLPGGPEDPSLGARGAVHRVDPATGGLDTVATGLLSPTGVAVAPNGDVFVAELFGNQISRIPAGSESPARWIGASLPGDVEFANGRIWATRKVLTGVSGGKPAGQVVRYRGGLGAAS